MPRKLATKKSQIAQNFTKFDKKRRGCSTTASYKISTHGNTFLQDYAKFMWGHRVLCDSILPDYRNPSIRFTNEVSLDMATQLTN